MQSRLTSALSYLGREALRIVLPSWCAACGAELPWFKGTAGRTASCCAACWASLPKIAGPKCVSCALPWNGDAESFLCLTCRIDPLPLEWCEAWGEYRGALERLLHAMKFERHDFLDDALATLLVETLLARRDTRFDAVTAVPMSRAKERRRGYNQAELLARALARRIAVPYELSLLTRAREQATQSMLPKRDRAANVRGAFAASPAARDKSILIVDDITTTGETLRACATALNVAGASRVCAIAVAKAV